MRLITAVLILYTALLFGCESKLPQPQPMPQLPQAPQYGANEPAPYVMPPTPVKEQQLYITGAKVVFVTYDTVAIEFNTNVPARSDISLMAGESLKASNSIGDKVMYHYYKFDNLKQLTQHYAIMVAKSETSDKAELVFMTQGNIDPYYQQPQEYYTPYFYYPSPYYSPPYTPPYVPPVIPTPFWGGTVTVIVN
jgi:hypothetical protein